VITLPKAIEDQMIAHARALFPIECCGYLAGTIETDGLHVKALYKMTNLDQKEDHFTFDPKEQFSVVKDARAKGLSLLSVYHSHPYTPSRLSKEDLALLVDPNMIYFIVSLEFQDNPVVNAFQTKDNQSVDVLVKRV
jgi:[CysO sulfur-carrier protein]-S-L-cysteine hydrolase